MNRFLTGILSTLSLLIAKSPGLIQTLIAQLLFFIAYYLPGYRKKIVKNNLELCFPALTETERKEITKKFYRHLSNVILEINALRTIQAEEYREKVNYKNLEMLENLLAEGKSVIVAYAHYGNWEYSTALPLFINYPVYAVYRPLSNSTADELMSKTRSRFGVTPLAMNHIYKVLSKDVENKKNHVAIFVADQTPPRSQIKSWFPFFNQPTAFFRGIERIARKLGHTVLYLEINKEKPLQYTGEFKLISDRPEDTFNNEITMRYVKFLEETIRKNPPLWLWSHRRWKHKPDGSISYPELNDD